MNRFVSRGVVQIGRVPLILSAIATSIVAVGCGGESTGGADPVGGDASASASNQESSGGGASSGATSSGSMSGGGGGDGGAPSFATDVYPILSASCVLCHSYGSGASGLRMSGGASSVYNAVTTHSATGQCAFTGDKLIVAGNATQSLFYLKLSSAPPCGSRMPIGAPLSQTQVATVMKWIDEGARP